MVRMQHNATTTLPDDHLQTEARTAARLGLATITLRQMRARGEAPPHVQIGRTIRYSRRAVDAWIAARTHGSAK